MKHKNTINISSNIPVNENSTYSHDSRIVTIIVRSI